MRVGTDLGLKTQDYNIRKLASSEARPRLTLGNTYEELLFVPLLTTHNLQNFIMVCKDCITGALHEGTPVGRVETIHGLPTYISEPPSGQAPQGLIVIIPDAFGWEFNNNRILADSYAKRTNSLVYLPEFMNGYAMDPSLFLTMDIIMGNGWKIGKMSAFARFYVQVSSVLISSNVVSQLHVRYPLLLRSYSSIAKRSLNLAFTNS